MKPTFVAPFFGGWGRPHRGHTGAVHGKHTSAMRLEPAKRNSICANQIDPDLIVAQEAKYHHEIR